MQECDVVLRLGGSLLHTVPKAGVTPGEIQVLRAIHGQDAVVDVVPTRFNKRKQEAEFERLNALYGQGTPLAPDGEGNSRNLISKLYPGVSPRLPVHLREIGLGHLVDKNLHTPKGLAAGSDPDVIEETDEEREALKGGQDGEA